MPSRPLPLVAVSLLCGSLTGAAAVYFPACSFFFALLLLLVLLILTARHRCPASFACLLFGVFLAGIVTAAMANLRSVPLIVGDGSAREKQDLIGEIVEPVRYGRGHAAAVVSVQRVIVSQESLPAKGRIRVNIRGEAPQLILGDVIRFRSRLHAPRQQLNHASFDYTAYLRQHGIQAVGSLSLEGDGSSLQLLNHVSHSVFDVIDTWRGRLREGALHSLDPAAASLYLSLITGESGYLSQETRDAFMASGTTHILSISGSHLGLIGVVVFGITRRIILHAPTGWLLRLTLRTTPQRLAAMATIPVVTLYAILGGAEVATVRSLLMLAVFLGGVLLGRTHSLLVGLAFATLMIVAWDPMAPLDLSFQLSFVSVLVILLLTYRPREAPPDGIPVTGVSVPPGQRMVAGARTWTRDVLVVTLAVTVVTAPLVALHFRQIAWVGLVANLVVIPLVGFFVVPLGLLSGLATLWSNSDVLVGAGWLQSTFDILLKVVGGFGAIPGARWMVASPPLWQVLVFYACVGAAVFRWRDRWVVYTAGGVAAGLLVLWAWSPRDIPPAGSVRVTFLDVGQGDASVIETSGGQVMVIDGGGASDWGDQGRAVVAPYLWDHGVRRLDVVVATHPQLDHIGGLASVVRQFPIGEFWTNGISREVVFVQQLEHALQARQVQVRAVSTRDPPFLLGPCQLRIHNPEPLPSNGASAFTGRHLNDHSVVVRMLCGGQTMLFTGDIEQEAEARLVAAGAVHTGVLKVPHHGSRGSLYEPFLRAVQPDLAVVSAGAGNPYGHPTAAMLQSYDQLHIPVLRTDRDGAVTIVQSASGHQIMCEAGRRLRRVRPGQANAWQSEYDNVRRLWRARALCPTLS